MTREEQIRQAARKYFDDYMESIRTSKEILKEWVETNMKTQTDWTGTRVETEYICDSIDEFVDKLYEYLADNHWRC